MVPVITGIKVKRHMKDAIKLLKSWDYRLDRESQAAALYDRWEQGMLKSLNQQLLPHRPDNASQLISRPKLMAWMVQPPEFVFGKKPMLARNKMIVEKLGEAINSLNTEFGENAWQYGDLHYTRIDHPLKSLAGNDLKAVLKIGPLPRGGGPNTLNANHGAGKQSSGASFRMIADTSDWNTAVGTNTPGQSGDPRSPYYSNLFENWNKGDYFPLYFAREVVEENTHSLTQLLPAK